MATAIRSPQQLLVKSYFAHSVPDAIQAAKNELGTDAMLLNSRPARPEERYLGELEVTFGKYPDNEVPVSAARAPSVSTPGRIDELLDRMDHMYSLLAKQSAYEPTLSGRPHGIAFALTEAGVHAPLAAEIEESVGKRLAEGTDARNRQAAPTAEMVRMEVSRELESRLRFEPQIGRITAFVGAPGVGKTTSLVKLAVIAGVALGRPVRIISADTQRIGAAGQLRTYADILGTPFQAVGNPAELAHALESIPEQTLTLIDTPGLSPALMNEMGGELADFLSERQDIDTQLVLTATAHRTDLLRTAERFNCFRPGRLIFTQMDEAGSPGAMYSAAVHLRKPLSYFCGGQLIPEDIGDASAENLVGPLLAQLPRSGEAKNLRGAV